MAIITIPLRRLMAQAFFDKLGDSSTHNVYFYIGRSRPWLDELAIEGDGTLSLPAGSTTLWINNGSLSSIPVGSTIKNLDTNEVRQIMSISGGGLQAVVNAPPTIPWSTDNWAWKEAGSGRIWVDDNNPPVPNSSLKNINERFSDMLALKRLNQTNLNDNVSYVIPRYNWDISEQTVYIAYDDGDGDLLYHPTQNDVDEANAWNAQHPQEAYTPGSHFVVVNYGSNYHVFKCLENGGIHNKSVEIPDKSQCTQANNFTQTCADGYKWKFMYTLSGDQVLRFLTDSWVPIRVAVDPNIDPSEQNEEQWRVQQAAQPGAIDNIRLISCPSAVVFYGDGLVGNILPNQSGVAINQIRLPDDASDINDYYKGCDVFIYSSDSLVNAQKRTIISYLGASLPRIATLDSDWAYAPTSADNLSVAPKIGISGQIDLTGHEASARAVVNGSGYITEIKMLDIGRNYRLAQAKCTVNDLEVANVNAEVSSIGGHGSNALDELGGYFVMIYVQLRNIEGDENLDKTRDFMLSNDYRSLGIVRNVLLSNGIDYAIDNTLKACKTLIITATTPSDGEFIVDEVIEYRDSQSNLLASGYVVEYIKDQVDPTLGTISFVQDVNSGFGSFEPVAGAVLIGLHSAVQASVDTLESAEIDDFTGDMLYIEQRKPIVRATEQLEDIKLVIEF